VEVFGGVLNFDEHYEDPALEAEAQQFQEEGGLSFFRRGTSVPLGVAFVQETTVFREFGPLAGNTMRLAYQMSPKIGNTLSRQTVDGDIRYYLRLGGSGLLALRGRGFRSWGDAPDFTYFGGNSEMRGYEYLEFIGHNAFFGNAELRFPLIEAMLTPIGVLGGIRGVAFFNIGSASFNVDGQTVNGNGEPFKFASSSSEVLTPFLGWDVDLENRQLIPIFGDPIPVDGFRLVDGRASYGVGLETFALGFPIHFDWSWKTTFNRAWEDYFFADRGGSGAFRDVKFSVWIGYDF